MHQEFQIFSLMLAIRTLHIEASGLPFHLACIPFLHPCPPHRGAAQKKWKVHALKCISYARGPLPNYKWHCGIGTTKLHTHQPGGHSLPSLRSFV